MSSRQEGRKDGAEEGGVLDGGKESLGRKIKSRKQTGEEKESRDKIAKRNEHSKEMGRVIIEYKP